MRQERLRPIITLLCFLLASCATERKVVPPDLPSPSDSSPEPSPETSSLVEPVAELATTEPDQAEPEPDPDSLIPRPPGFPAADEFTDLETACDVLVPRRVERDDLHEVIVGWCHTRAYASSRNGRAKSRLDGSWIHDRDRPAAYNFYRHGLRSGHLDPDTCPHHVVDETLKRDRTAREFPDNWPYGTHCDHSQGPCSPRSRGHMDPTLAAKWMSRAPDYERFGTRGPMDNHVATAVKYLGGCWPPETIDRFDVSAATVIERSEDLCLRLEAKLGTRKRRQAAKNAGLPTRCRNSRDLRRIWHPKFWYQTLPQALERG